MKQFAKGKKMLYMAERKAWRRIKEFVLLLLGILVLYLAIAGAWHVTECM